MTCLHCNKPVRVKSVQLCMAHYARLRRNGHPLKGTHDGRSKDNRYGTYYSMKKRCYVTTHISYPNYGGRGIKICDRWLGKDGFKNFCEDMGDKPTTGHSIDRINNDGDYEPSNCRWASRIEQNSHRRNSNDVVGVAYDKNRGSWLSYIYVNGMRKMSRSKTFEEAVKKRLDFERMYVRINA